MLKRLYLQHFRSYEEAEVTFSPGVNWFIGKNAQGKTNLLEAIYLLSCGRSFRTSQLSQLIQKGAHYFYIEAEMEKDGVAQSIKISFDGENKKVQCNATTYSHFTPLLGLIPMVLYAPEDISLISGVPAFRRKFLDLHLSQIDPLYLHHLARFHRSLRQRNELLKKQIEETIDSWEEPMAQSAKYLMEKRRQCVASLQEPLRNTLLTFSSDQDQLQLKYQPSLPSFELHELIECFRKNRKKELHIGTTLFGPHRDDLLFSIDSLSAKSYASIGQKHSILAAIRLCIWEHIKERSDAVPLFGIDDFGAHLDPSRQKNFEQKLQNLGQIFLTSPTSNKEIFSQKQIVEIDSGKILHISSA